MKITADWLPFHLWRRLTDEKSCQSQFIYKNERDNKSVLRRNVISFLLVLVFYAIGQSLAIRSPRKYKRGRVATDKRDEVPTVCAA